MISLRPAEVEDFSAIREVLLSAFETPVEADLVEALRAEGCVILELVAENDEGVAGHILYSELPIEAAARTVRGRRWRRWLCIPRTSGSVSAAR